MKNAITPPKLIIQDLTPGIVHILSDGVARDIELLKNVPISPTDAQEAWIRIHFSTLYLCPIRSTKSPSGLLRQLCDNQV
jgi:hypothetical protein